MILRNKEDQKSKKEELEDTGDRSNRNGLNFNSMKCKKEIHQLKITGEDKNLGLLVDHRMTKSLQSDMATRATSR